jgi:hypothetical protein
MKSAAPIIVPVPRRDIPLIGADIIQSQLWPSVGAKRFGNRNSWIVAFRLTLRIRFFHVADEGLPAVIHMNMFNADNLMSAMTQASKNLCLRRVRPHQTSRSRTP